MNIFNYFIIVFLYYYRRVCRTNTININIIIKINCIWKDIILINMNRLSYSFTCFSRHICIHFNISLKMYFKWNWKHENCNENEMGTGKKKVVLDTIEKLITTFSQLAINHDPKNNKTKVLSSVQTTFSSRVKYDDFNRSIHFCETVINKIDKVDKFVEKIQFSDEATFCFNGFNVFDNLYNSIIK